MKLKQKIIFGLFGLFFWISNVSAQSLENIPGQTPVGEGDLIGFLNNLYKFGISITGILAIFMIGVGAFAYIVTSVGNSSKMIDAKEKIQNALIGLVIVLTAYLFLYVINPDLVNGTLTAPKTTIDNIVLSNSAYDGVECNDTEGTTRAGTCPTCPLCSEICPGKKYGKNEHVYCGENPVVTAKKAAAAKLTPDTMGCCAYSFSKKCEPLISYADCLAKGTAKNVHFTPGTNVTCGVENNYKVCVSPPTLVDTTVDGTACGGSGQPLCADCKNGNYFDEDKVQHFCGSESLPPSPVTPGVPSN